MLENNPPQDFRAVVKYGAGLNTRMSEDDILDEECSDGQNFSLDLENKHFRPRKPFDLKATTPNAGQINGFIQLLKKDGTIATAVQAADKVYAWDGSSGTGGFTELATVSTNARLHGNRESTWALDDKVLIGDLAKVEQLKEWNGGTGTGDFIDTVHNLTGDFIVKYPLVDQERAFYLNVSSNGVDTPHLIAGSERGNHDAVSVATRAEDAVGAGDAFFLLAPDLKPINGATLAFGLALFSTHKGNIFRLNSSSTAATDFGVGRFFAKSGGTGNEALVNVGNDVFVSRFGAIDTLSGIEAFGDVAVDDLTRVISNSIEDVASWKMVYNQRLQRVYCFPAGVNECWVLDKSRFDDVVSRVARRQAVIQSSPWMKWKTDHAATFIPSAVANIYDPVTGRDEVYFGDSSGNLYQLEGSGEGDGGTTDIIATRTSKILRLPANDSWDGNGWIYYRRDQAFSVGLDFLFSGDTVYETKTNVVAQEATGIYFGGGSYFGDGSGFGSKGKHRIRRQEYSQAGSGSQFQVRTTVKGTKDFSISEVGVRVTG